MDKLLSYHDVLLRTSDLEALEDGSWLNDQIIAFFFEYLSRDVFKTLNLALVSGATAFLLLHSAGREFSDTLGALRAGKQQLMLFAINDNPYVTEAEGGSHWSLLVFSTHDHTFRHYDSLKRGGNGQLAQSLGLKIYEELRLETFKFERMDSPQQQNGYDCGMYVLAVAQCLCQRFHDHGINMDFRVSMSDITQSDVTQLRTSIRQTIFSMADASKHAPSSAKHSGQS